jgi:predicted nucleic acid-binding protein
MIYLVDTNVILRLVDPEHPLHQPARQAVRQLKQSHRLQVTGQNLIEFWGVATRPAYQNGLGWGLARARQVLRTIEQLFPLLPDSPAVYAEWRQLVFEFGVSGVKVHDARLVAAMKVSNVTRILTFNRSDFARFEGAGILAIDPRGALPET